MSTRTALLAVLLVVVGVRPVPALDLEGALREAAAANPALAQRRAMAEAAAHRVAPAGAWESPMLELGVVNLPTSGRFDMDPMTMKMVGLSQRVPLFGANRLSRRSALEAASAEREALELAGYETSGAVFEAYCDAYYAGQLDREATDHQAGMDQLVQAARVRYEAGGGRLDDLLRAEAERARTLADLASFRAEAQSARARLDALRGLEPGAPAETLAAPPAPLVPAESSAWLGAISPAHPRLRGLEAEAGRYRLAARAARRMLWPDLQLSASYGMRERLLGVRQDGMVTATAGVMVPLFARSRELAMGAELDAMAEASRWEGREAELDLRRQVSETWSLADAARRTVALFADTVLVAQRRALDASWVAYGAGTTDLWRVFEASHALYQEQIALVRARQDLARALGRALALTGDGALIGLPAPATQRGER